MPKFNNLKDLLNYIKKEVQDSLEKDVSQKVIEVAQEHVEIDVYDVYTPKIYQRTGELKDSFETRSIKDGIEIVNIRTDKETGKYIPTVIETGIGYDYAGYGYDYEKPRPFISNTRDDLSKNGQHVEALKESLEKKGFKTK